MNLNLDKITEKLDQNSFVKDFIKELSGYLTSTTHKNYIEGGIMNDIELTPEENFEFYRRRWDLLENFFKEELSNPSKGEVFIVTDKYENDYEYHRYKVTQYKDNVEHKCIAFENDLPENVQLGDVIRKIHGKYFYDEQATLYINNSLNSIKQSIINNRNII